MENVPYKNSFVMIGGTGSQADQVLLFDPEIRDWRNISGLSEPKEAPTAFLVDDTIFPECE